MTALPPETITDYPRPPRLEPVRLPVRGLVGGVTLFRTTAALRILETGLPPSYYIPPDDFRREHLEPNAARSFCPWKGEAVYWDLLLGDRRLTACAWSYPEPIPEMAPIRNYLAIYANQLDSAWVGEMAVDCSRAAHGGWITPNLKGPLPET